MTSKIGTFESENAMLEAARSGDQDALNQIIKFYEPEVRKIACKYFLPRADYEDLLQEGRIAIFKAVLAYNPESEIPFLHFLRMVIKRKLIDSLRAHNRQKHLNLNDAFSLNNSLREEQEESFIDVLPNVEDPEMTVITQDEARSLLRNLTQEFSKLELSVFQYHFIAGLKQREISQRLGLSPKSLDNAIQRIRRKTLSYRSREIAG